MNASILPRPVLLAGLVVAGSLTLAACSGIADDAPQDADTQAFCDAVYDRTLTAQEAAANLVDIGTPDDLTDDERQGFELWVEGLDNEGDTPNAKIEQVEVPQSDKDSVEAFIDYVGDTCLAATATATPSPSP